MTIVLGLDIGTTTITSMAIETATGHILASTTLANQAQTRHPGNDSLGRSEWDATAIMACVGECLATLTEQLGSRTSQILGLGLTGQQHGVILVDTNGEPCSPYINWQDRRGEHSYQGHDTYVDFLRDKLGDSARARHGCLLAAGYMGLTLAWLNDHQQLPTDSTAAFIMDYAAATLTGSPVIVSPSSAGSSGIYDVHQHAWNLNAIDALGLSSTTFPSLGQATDQVGSLNEDWAAITKLPPGLPVFVAIGDNQASFLGSVSHRHHQLLINVGTGGQVAIYSDHAVDHPDLEIRPFPLGGYLLASTGICGGRSYAQLEQFFRSVCSDMGQREPSTTLFQRMNALGHHVPAGCDGLTCSPLFTGTPGNPQLRASWEGVGLDNFTAGHMTRALLEGMSRVFATGYQTIQEMVPEAMSEVIGAGNGMRENRLLRECIQREFNLPLRISANREEACTGAAMIAAVGAGALESLDDAVDWFTYECDKTG